MKICRIAILAFSSGIGVSTAFTPFSSSGLAILTRTRQRYQTSREASTQDNDIDFSDPLRPVFQGETLRIPFSDNEVELDNGVVNDGPYSWIAPYMKLGGYKAGSSVKGGIATTETTSYSDDEKEMRRQKATVDMVNISDEERALRREQSNAFYVAAFVYAVISALFLDDGSFAGHLWRFAIFLPLSSAYGLQLSANRGL